jgi:hypothetical protein
MSFVSAMAIVPYAAWLGTVPQEVTSLSTVEAGPLNGIALSLVHQSINLNQSFHSCSKAPRDGCQIQRSSGRLPVVLLDKGCHLASPCSFGITLPVVQSQTVPWPLRSKHLMPNAIWHHPVHLASHWTMPCQWFRVKLFPGP